jgi:hypothetical protein
MYGEIIHCCNGIGLGAEKKGNLGFTVHGTFHNKVKVILKPELCPCMFLGSRADARCQSS